jgi:hypothetical protein
VKFFPNQQARFKREDTKRCARCTPSPVNANIQHRPIVDLKRFKDILRIPHIRRKSSKNQPSRSNGSRTSRATIGVIIWLSGLGDLKRF